MILLFANGANSTLSGAIAPSATTLSVQAGQGALFPQPVPGTSYFKLTLKDAATLLNTEIVQVTDRVGDLFTIVRAQEGTAAQNWAASDPAAALVTAGTMETFIQEEQLQPVRIVTASGAFTTTLADANGSVGLNRTSGVATSSTALPAGAAASDTFTFQDLASNFFQFPVTVAAPAGQTICGAASVVLNVNKQAAQFRYFGSNVWGVRL